MGKCMAKILLEHLHLGANKTHPSPHLAAIMDKRPDPAPTSSASSSAQPAARLRRTACWIAASYASLRC